MMAGRTGAALHSVLAAVTGRAALVIAGMAGLAVVSLLWTAEHLGFDTDTADLIDADLPFRQAYEHYTRQFPQYGDTLVAVVEARAPEFADAAAEHLQRVLAERPERFPSVYRPRGGEFLERHALLYLDQDRLAAVEQGLAQAQPLLARLARQPSIVGYFDLLDEIATRRPEAAGEFAAVHAASARALAADEAVISWQRLLRGEPAESVFPERAFVVAGPRLDYERVMAGRSAMEAARAAVDSVQAEHPATRIRLTGKVALQYEELQSALDGAGRAALAALALVVVVLYAALRSWRLLAAALITLAAGMALSAGVATVAVGHLNLISIAFAVLYVGLGINYAVHYLIRYREALAEGQERRAAAMRAGERLGGALTLCTVTTAIGFFAFVPTDFAGVAELGLIAGLSMGVTLVVTYTLLPALLMHLRAPRASGFRAAPPLPRRWLEWPARHPAVVRAVTVVLALASLAIAAQVRFDADPLNLRDRDSESVATAMDLVEDGSGVRDNLAVLVDDRERLATMAQRLEALEAVRTTIDLRDLVPAGQAQKVARIRDLAFILGPVITEQPFELAPAPSVDAAVAAAGRLRQTLRSGPADTPASRELARALEAWQARVRRAGDPVARVQALQQRVLGTLPFAIDRLQKALQGAEAFDAADLPEELRARYRSDDGTHLLQVFPRQPLDDTAARERFVEAVRSVAPEATGAPVLQLESGRAVVAAFRTALASAIAGITIVLLILLRRVGTVLRVLVPLLLGGLLTVAAMVLLGLPFNFANVIALPLLFGVGVDNGIHMVSRQREADTTGPLQSSTARAILFGTLATVVSFGNLALSPHRGTATMGIVLAIGMILILATTFLVLPALARRARSNGGP